MKRGLGKQSVEGKGFRLADEVGYIQNKAAEQVCQFFCVNDQDLFLVMGC